MAAMKERNTRRKQTRPPNLRSFPAFPTGPRLYRLAKGVGLIHGPGEPPPAFLTFTNSRSEWVIYWAIAKALGVPRDPRKGPYIGWPGTWAYQTPLEGGRAVRGGQVVDFLINNTATGGIGAVAIRIQTERYHQFTDAVKHAKDELLRIRIARYERVADIFEQDFISDRSGQAAVMEVKRAIFGGSASNPLRAGRARRVRL